ncbi:DUF2267 domain-containing protein [Streptomyces sp. CC210A]|uniref:DUF2267 domain-containing protein n=1 Tax=Streptomyces sp. CC210A TaxID=2898184 RepID=UPI001F2EA89F|nr:DUF2267 domain-containing protein [Streptomyces sp. CC210A]
MQTLPHPTAARPAVSYRQMLERVRYEGVYPTRERAEEVVRTVLGALGRQVTGEERVALAASLPRQAALMLTSQPPENERLTGWAFVKDIATRSGASLATTRWDVGSVLTTVAHLAGPDLTDRLLRRLPQGYALLFGRAQLAQTA